MKHFENEIVLGMIRSQEFLPFVAELDFNSKQFENRINGWTYRKIIGYYKKYNQPPTKKVLITKINKSKKLKDDDKVIYKKHLNKLFKKKKPKELEYIKDETLRYFKRQNFVKALHTSVELIKENDNVEEAEKSLLHDLYKIGGNQTETKTLDWLDNWEQRQEDRKLGNYFSDGKLIKTGFKKLDLVIEGIYPGEVLSFVAQTGVGKSIAVTNVGANAFLSGDRVLHITSENALWQALGRYDARILKLSYKLLQNSKLVDCDEEYADKVIELIRKKIKSRLKVAEVTPNNFNILTVRNIIDKYRVTEGFEPDLVILDSAELMNPITKHKEYRLQKAAAYWEFKGLMIDYKIAGVTTTQAKSKIDDAIGITSEDLAEAYDKARLLDKIIGLTRTLEDILKNEITFHVAKNRDGAGSEYIKLPTDFSRIAIFN